MNFIPRYNNHIYRTLGKRLRQETEVSDRTGSEKTALVLKNL